MYIGVSIYQILLCYNTPDCHPFITDYERTYLLDELGQQQPKSNDTRKRKTTKRTPWRQILTNVPFIALILCQVSWVSATISENVLLLYVCVCRVCVYIVDPLSAERQQIWIMGISGWLLISSKFFISAHFLLSHSFRNTVIPHISIKTYHFICYLSENRCSRLW